MAEFIEREKADVECALLIKDIQNCRDYYSHSIDEVLRKTKELLTKIRTIPAADVVEVVRCKDCKHRYVPARCALWYATMNGKEYFVERGENFYCSYGERKTEQ